MSTDSNYTTFLQHYDAVTRQLVHTNPADRALYLMLVEHSHQLRPVFERSPNQDTFFHVIKHGPGAVAKYDPVIAYLLAASNDVWTSMSAAGLPRTS